MLIEAFAAAALMTTPSTGARVATEDRPVAAVQDRRGGRHDRPGRPGRPGYGGGGITVYRDANYRGASAQFDGEMPNLANTGFNDTISSMRLRGSWEICTDAYFRGDCRVLTGDVWNLQTMRLNDHISSLRPVRR